MTSIILEVSRCEELPQTVEHESKGKEGLVLIVHHCSYKTLLVDILPKPFTFVDFIEPNEISGKIEGGHKVGMMERRQGHRPAQKPHEQSGVAQSSLR